MRRGSTQKALDVPPFDVVIDMQGASSLGIGLNDLNYICSIEPGSVASKHGLQLGDQVLAWQGELLGGQLLTLSARGPRVWESIITSYHFT